VTDGADSYLIEDGRIVAQTIHYTVQQKRQAGEHTDHCSSWAGRRGGSPPACSRCGGQPSTNPCPSW
jgi:hypothetical protein